ncbi:MAG: hypothetical protein HFH32_17855 [Eubacterium sp.]|jgi:hypothetical protein|nr:hypothetical protein [Eubacterium sp.]
MLSAQKQPEKKKKLQKKYQSGVRPFMQNLRGKAKLQFFLQYLWDYYKLPLAAAAIALYIALYAVYGHFTHKDTALYAALVNVAVGETLTEELSSRFLTAQNLNTNANTFRLYSGLYLTDDENSIYHEYTYASRLKILASIDAEQLDVALMDKEAFDAFSQNGYLSDIDELLAEEVPALHQQLAPYFVTNTVILEDNSEDLLLDSSAVYHAETEDYPMGLDLSASPLIQKGGFQETVYLGIIKNSPRMHTVFDYLEYLFKLNSSSLYK